MCGGWRGGTGVEVKVKVFPAQSGEFALAEPGVEGEFEQRVPKRKYSHTQWEMISTGYRCPLYDGGALSTDGPPPP